LTTAREDVQPLTTPLKVFLGLLGAASATLVTMAFVGMFAAVRASMIPYFHQFAWMIPVGTDLGILLLSGFAVFLELAGMPLWWLRGAILTLLGLQLSLNIGAAHGSPLGMAGHAVLPTLFIATVEVWIYIVRKRRGLIGTKTGRDRIPLARYVHDWPGSREIRRAMILYGIDSYQAALDMLQMRKLAETSLTIMYPAGDAPADLVLKLTLPKYVSEACEQIERQRRKFDSTGQPPARPAPKRPDTEKIPVPGPKPGGTEKPAAAPQPDCCDAHRAAVNKKPLPMEKANEDKSVDPIGNAILVHDKFVEAHGRVMGRDFIGAVFGIGSANAAKLRDDIRAAAESGARSGSGSDSEPGRESGQPGPGKSGPVAGLANGASAGSGAR
jgi:hypothetical protein